MAEHKFMFDSDVAKAMVSCIPNEIMADLAAEGRSECDMFTCEVKDSFHREITIGHALVIVAYGSEASCARLKAAIMSTAKEI